MDFGPCLSHLEPTLLQSRLFISEPTDPQSTSIRRRIKVAPKHRLVQERHLPYDMSFAIDGLSGSTKPNGRLGSRKSRRGCLTCKKRKVKCDEAKPICGRCAAGGHTCQGYTDPFISNDTRAVARASRSPSTHSSVSSSFPPSRSISPLPLDPVNLRAFHYFSAELSPVLGAPLGKAFWETSVLRVSQSEPAVQQALTALSALYEHAQQSDQLASSPRSSLATRQYNKALATTAQRVAQGDGDLVALITCILFLCFEFLQQNQVGAFSLLAKGANILHGLMRHGSTSPSSRTTLLLCSVLPVFERLALLSALFGFSIPPFPRKWADTCFGKAGVPTEFTTLEEAKIILYWRLVHIHDLMKRSQPYRDCVTTPDDNLKAMLVEQEQHMSALETWRVNLDALSTLVTDQEEDADLEAALRMYHAITQAWLSCALQPLETAYDDHCSLFKAVVDQAEALSRSTRGARARRPFFSFEMGVIPPLYMTVLKCRDPAIRARALNNLYQAPAQESLWTRVEAIRVAERALAVERQLAHGIMPGTFETLPTTARVSEVKIFGEKKQGWEVWFYVKLDGRGEVHRCWQEIVT